MRLEPFLATLALLGASPVLAPAAHVDAPRAWSRAPEASVPHELHAGTTPASSTPVAAPEVTADRCEPECRAGFTCASRQCVSAPAFLPPDACSASVLCASELAIAIDEAIERRAEKSRAATVRRHDGVYVRLGVNLGYAIDTAQNGQFETESSGPGAMIDCAGGFNATRHVVLALAMHWLRVPSPRTAENGIDLREGHTASYFIAGPLVDVYPDPSAGAHATATLGIAGANINPREGEDTSSGLGLAIGAGYDLWVADQWSLGAIARIAFITGAREDFGEHQTILPTLTLSALLH